MRYWSILLVSALLLFRIPAVQAKDPKWFEMSSEHFLLLTDTNEAKGRRLISDFENRVAAFSQAFGKVPARQFPIEIFLFNNEQDFIEALPHEQGEEQLRKAAYLLRGPDRTFIVAKDKSPDDIANDAGHALGHVLFERYVLWRPFWLAEGAAEYVRKAGRPADTKAVSEQEGFSAGDVVTIVPSATYNDDDPGGAFRTESYRLLRILLDEKPDLIRQYLQSLRMESEHAPVNDIDAPAMDSRLKSYVETPLKMPPVTAAVKSSEADMARLAIHRGERRPRLVRGSSRRPGRLERGAGPPDSGLATHVLTAGQQREQRHNAGGVTWPHDVRHGIQLHPLRFRVHDPAPSQALQPVVPRQPEAGRHRQRRPFSHRPRGRRGTGGHLPLHDGLDRRLSRAGGALGQRGSRRAHGHLRRRRAGLAADLPERNLGASVRSARALRLSLHPASIHDGGGDRQVTGRGKGEGQTAWTS